MGYVLHGRHDSLAGSCTANLLVYTRDVGRCDLWFAVGQMVVFSGS